MPRITAFITLPLIPPTAPGRANAVSFSKTTRRQKLSKLVFAKTLGARKTQQSARAVEARRAEVEEVADALQRQRRATGGEAHAKRDLSLRANGTIDPWYGCFIYDEMIDYAFNFSKPWSAYLPVSALWA